MKYLYSPPSGLDKILSFIEVILVTIQKSLSTSFFTSDPLTIFFSNQFPLQTQLKSLQEKYLHLRPNFNLYKKIISTSDPTAFHLRPNLNFCIKIIFTLDPTAFHFRPNLNFCIKIISTLDPTGFHFRPNFIFIKKTISTLDPIGSKVEIFFLLRPNWV